MDGTDEEFLFTYSFLVAITRAGTGAGGLFTCKCFVLLYPRSFWRLDIHLVTIPAMAGSRRVCQLALLDLDMWRQHGRALLGYTENYNEFVLLTTNF